MAKQGDMPTEDHIEEVESMGEKKVNLNFFSIIFFFEDTISKNCQSDKYSALTTSFSSVRYFVGIKLFKMRTNLDYLDYLLFNNLTFFMNRID